MLCRYDSASWNYANCYGGRIDRRSTDCFVKAGFRGALIVARSRVCFKSEVFRERRVIVRFKSYEFLEARTVAKIWLWW